MYYYIEETSSGEILPSKGKIEGLILDGATIIEGNPLLQSDLVCVIDNNHSEEALYISSKTVYDEMNDPNDQRAKTWLLYAYGAEASGSPELKLHKLRRKVLTKTSKIK